MKKIILFACLMVLIPVFCLAASVDLRWEAVPGATGYKVYQSINAGVSWTVAATLGNVLTATLTNVPDTGEVLFRFSAFNAQTETIRMNAGVWYNGSWTPLSILTGPGIR